MNTRSVFLNKCKEKETRDFDHASWQLYLRWEIDEMGVRTQELADPIKCAVRPILMGEFMRQWVGKRLQQCMQEDIQRVMQAARQLWGRSRGRGGAAGNLPPNHI